MLSWKEARGCELAMFTREIVRVSTEGATRSRESEANRSNTFQCVTLGKLLNLSTLPFPCLRSTNSNDPELSFMLSTKHSARCQAHRRFHVGVTYYHVWKLLHCFSIKINHIVLVLTSFQKLEELVESLCWSCLTGRSGCLHSPSFTPPTATT